MKSVSRLHADPPRGAPWSVVRRFLALIGDVHAEEVRPVSGMLLSIFLILTSYYLLKPVRDGWLAVSGTDGLSGTELKAYTTLAQALVLVVLIPVHSWLASHVRRRVLIGRANLFFAAHLLLFWILRPGSFLEAPHVGIAFSLWIGIFNVSVLAQFWSFATDLLDASGRRLVPVVAVGGSAGAVAGSFAAARLVSSGLVTTFSLLPVAAVLLGASVLFLRRIESSGPLRPGRAETTPAAPGGSGAFGLIFGHRYLALTAAFVLLLSWLGAAGENLLFGVVHEHIAEGALEQGITDPALASRFVADRTTAFYGNFFFWTNLVALFVQMFLVSRVVCRAGFAAALLTLPVVSLLSYGMTALGPALAILKTAKIAENAATYSIHNTASQLLWVPVTAEMRYKAKAAIDTLFVRAGDGLAALTVFVGIQLLGLPLSSLAWVNVALAGGLVGMGILVARERRRLADPAAVVVSPEGLPGVATLRQAA